MSPGDREAISATLSVTPSATRRPLAALLWAKHRMAAHFLASARHESKLKILVVGLFAVLLWWGLFAFARFGFGIFEDFGAEILGGGELSLSDLIMARLLSLFTLALFVMLVFSNVLAAFTFFYRTREVPFLVQSPISPEAFFVDRFADCVSFSSWALGYLGSPVLIAYGIETGAPWPFYPLLLAFYLPFVILPAALGTTVTVGLVRIFAGLKRGPLIAIASVVVLVLFAIFRRHLRLTDFADTSSLQAVLEALGQTQTAWLPSFWTSRGLLSAATGSSGEAFFYWLLLTANALMAGWIASEVSRRWFYRGWTQLAGGDEVRRPSHAGGWLGARGLLGRLDAGMSWIWKPSTRALVIKDLRVFWRDASQWTQFLLLFGIMAIYIAQLDGSRGGTDDGLWRAWGSLLNMAACALILASLTTRFIFPLISLEGRRFWILGLAPLERRRLAWQKFWLSCGTTSLFTVGLIALSAWRLELDATAFAVSVIGVIATTLALSGLAVGLGCLYPNFEAASAARIVSGLGGTLNFMLSLVYVVLILLAQALVLLWHRLDERFAGAAFPWVVAAALAWTVGLTAVTCWLPMRLGIHHLERVEF